jgi:hypothetical protein
MSRFQRSIRQSIDWVPLGRCQAVTFHAFGADYEVQLNRQGRAKIIATRSVALTAIT